MKKDGENKKIIMVFKDKKDWMNQETNKLGAYYELNRGDHNSKFRPLQN